MKIEGDELARRCYISLREIGYGEAIKTLEVDEDIYLDFDYEGKLIGIDIPDDKLSDETLAETEEN